MRELTNLPPPDNVHGLGDILKFEQCLIGALALGIKPCAFK